VSRAEADVMCLVSQSRGGLILLHEGHDPECSMLLAQAKATLEKEVKKATEEGHMYTVSVTCYDKRAADKAKGAYRHLATTGVSLSSALRRRILEEVPGAKEDLVSLSFPTTTNTHKWSGVGFETYWRTLEAAQRFVELINMKPEDDAPPARCLEDMDEGEGADERVRFDPLVL
jgi:hypothetical protein